MSGKEVRLVDAGFIHVRCLFFDLCVLRHQNWSQGTDSIHTNAAYIDIPWAFQHLMFQKKGLFIVSYRFIVEWGPCSRIKLGTLGGDTWWYHLAWSHDVTCYDLLRVVTCHPGTDRPAILCCRSAEWCERSGRKLILCNLGRMLNEKIWEARDLSSITENKGSDTPNFAFAIVTPVERHALRTSFTFPC